MLAMDMDPVLLQDLHLTHSITNYLLACYQGKFAALNILERLGYDKIPPGEIDKTERAFEQISKWVNDLWNGEPLFSTTWTHADNFDAERAYKLLEELVPDLARASQITRTLITHTDLDKRPEGTMVLLSEFGRYSYSQDNYVKGFVKFAQTFGIDAMMRQYGGLVAEYEAKVDLTHSFLNVFTSEEPEPSFYSSLIAVCRPLPGKFRMYIHDINQLLNWYGDFNFEKAGFDEDEAQRWKTVSIGPDMAGYWSAFDIGPELAFRWAQLGVPSAETAANWSLADYTPESCQTWLKYQFVPAVARRWDDAGFDAPTAYGYILRGIEFPEQIPEDDEEIVHKGYQGNRYTSTEEN